MTTAAPKRSLWQRTGEVAKTAKPTARGEGKGMRLDLSIYLYPDGHAHIETREGASIQVPDELRLIAALCEMFRRVKWGKPKE